MRMVIHYSCLLIVILCAFSSNAQEELRAATLITIDGDTLNGQIVFEDWDRSPRSIEFKDDQGTSPKSAEIISSFTITEPIKIFVSKKLTVSYYKKTVVREGNSPILRTDSATYFVEVLMHSSLLTLYEFFDDENQPRFFLLKDGKLHELRNAVYRVARGEAEHLVKTEVFKAQLKQLLPECPTLKTDNLRYTAKDLVNLLTEYHNYCKTDFRTEYKQQKLGERIALGAMYRYAPLATSPNSSIGLNVMFFSKKKFNSAFVSIDIGVVTGKEEEGGFTEKLTLGMHGGKYFGVGNWHAMVFTGISNTNGILDTGVGIMHKRMFALSTSVGYFPVVNGFGWTVQLRATPFSSNK